MRATAPSLLLLARSRSIPACNVSRFSPLRERRRLSSLRFSSAVRITRCRFVVNGINHSHTKMFLLYRYQQNTDLGSAIIVFGDLVASRCFLPVNVFLALDTERRPRNRTDTLGR